MPTMTIQDLLGRLQELQARKEAGEDVSAEVRQARDELRALQAQQGEGGPLSSDERRELEELRSKQARQQRGGSRFPSHTATDDILDLLAAGGSIHEGQLVPHGQKFAPSVVGAEKSLSASMVKALAEGVPSAGGVLVPQQVAAEVLTLVRGASAIFQMGPTIQPVEKELAITSLTKGATAGWVGENEPAPVSDPAFDLDVVLRPKELAGLLAASNRLVRDASKNPNLDEVLRRELAEVLSLAADRGYIEGTGTGNQPLGIIKQSGLTAAPSLGANGGTPTFDNLKEMVAHIRAVNGKFTRPGWVFNPRLLSTLEKVKDTTGRYLAEAGLLTFNKSGTGGTLLEYPFATTTEIPTNIKTGTNEDTTFIVFGSDWQECWVGVEEALTINISREAAYKDGEGEWQSAFQNRQTLWLAESVTDIALRRPQWFTVMSGVRP